MPLVLIQSSRKAWEPREGGIPMYIIKVKLFVYVIPKVLQLVLTARAKRKNIQPIVVIFIVVVVRSN